MKGSLKELALDLKPFHPLESLKVFLFKWLTLSLLISLLCYFVFPLREDLSTQLSLARFHVENSLWFIAAMTSATVFYHSSFPENTDRKFKMLSSFFLVTLFMLPLLGLGLPGQENEFFNEMNLYRGRCGFIILSISISHASYLTLWSKNAAPYRPSTTGIWAALSAGSLGCFLMQFICAHHNPLHLLLWHFIPLSLTCLIGSQVAKRFLRW